MNQVGIAATGESMGREEKYERGRGKKEEKKDKTLISD